MERIRRHFWPEEPGRRPSRAAYALPTFFTACNLLLGYVAILQSFTAANMASLGQDEASRLFEIAAMCIGAAVFLDGLDGRIARMTNTTSEFGKEMDSLADVISFGVAPAVLAFAWGVQFIDRSMDPVLLEHIRRAGYFSAFMFLLCGAVRLARFNITKNPMPKNPGRPDRKYFVGLPIPAGAGMVAAVVYAAGSVPIAWWPLGAAWIGLLLMLAFLMVSTWRYYSFKDINLLRPRSPLTVILLGAFVYLIWNWPQQILLAMGITYVGSGIVTRIGGVLKRRFRHAHPHPEHQVG